MVKRTVKRIPAKLHARLHWENNVYPGIITNISDRGMNIRSKMAPPFDAVMEVVIDVEDGHYKFPGNVRWTGLPTLNCDKDENCMGIELLDCPSDYQEFLERLESDQVSDNTS